VITPSLSAGIEHIILAMPHRGRLNLLSEPTLLKYPHAALFHKIKGKSEIPEEFDAAGDVVSHLCTYYFSCMRIYCNFYAPDS
jgi:2-oxoadipate dehydrogenase E1 component